jgi:hypothetical protein
LEEAATALALSTATRLALSPHTTKSLQSYFLLPESLSVKSMTQRRHDLKPRPATSRRHHVSAVISRLSRVSTNARSSNTQEHARTRNISTSTSKRPTNPRTSPLLILASLYQDSIKPLLSLYIGYIRALLRLT